MDRRHDPRCCSSRASSSAPICGAVAVNKGEPQGKTGLTVAIVGTVVGMLLGALVYANS